MLVSQNHGEFATLLAKMHAQCFEKGWQIDEMQTLLKLPTTHLWITKQGFLLCSEVAGEMEILTIGVLPEYRHQGIGLKLLTEMKNYARIQAIHHIFLEVAQDNIPAQKLYEKAGFSQIGIRPRYYQTNRGMIDALCLRLKID